MSPSDLRSGGTFILAHLAALVSVFAVCKLCLCFTSWESQGIYLFLALSWFLCNLAAQILCILLLFHGFPSLIGLQDDANWIAGAVGWPCLTTFFLMKSNASMPFICMHPTMSALILTIFVKIKLGSLEPSKLDLVKISLTWSSLCTASLIASCYQSNNINGLSACSVFVASQFVLATSFRTKDWNTLDLFLAGSAIANFMFLEAIFA